MKVDQIDIHLRPLRLCALLDLPATPSQGVNDDEIELLSVPVRLRRSGREIRMVINGTDSFAAKPDARLIKLLLRARRFNATLAAERRRSFCRTRRAGRGQPVLFHAARPPQLSRAGYHSGHPRWAAAARFNGREAPRALTSAACLARSADRARLCLIQIRISKTTHAKARKIPTSSGPSVALPPPHQPHCGTGIWPDRDIAAGRSAYRKARCVSADAVVKRASQTRAESRVLDLRKWLRKRDRLSAGGRWIRTIGTPQIFLAAPSIPRIHLPQYKPGIPRDRDRWAGPYRRTRLTR